MVLNKGYKTAKEQKTKTLYCRVDDSMASELSDIRNQTGISVSELLREGARRLIAEMREKGMVKLI